jgi:hypothetical protein
MDSYPDPDQEFQVNPDPDTGPGFWWPKTEENKIQIWSKMAFSPQQWKYSTSKIKFIIYYLFSLFVGHLRIQGTHWIRIQSGSTALLTREKCKSEYKRRRSLLFLKKQKNQTSFFFKNSAKTHIPRLKIKILSNETLSQPLRHHYADTNEHFKVEMRRVALDRPSDALVARLRNSVSFSFNSSLFNCLMATVFLCNTNSSPMISYSITRRGYWILTGLKLPELHLKNEPEDDQIWLFLAVFWIWIRRTRKFLGLQAIRYQTYLE